MRVQEQSVRATKMNERWPTEAVPLRFKFAKLVVVAEVICLPLAAVVLFAFDEWISQGLYALGYDKTIVSHLGFLRSQYWFIDANLPAARLKLYDFHIFELFFWLVIGVACCRIVAGLFFLTRVAARAELAKRNRSVSLQVAGWLLITLPALYLPLMGIEHMLVPHYLRDLLIYSPRGFLWFEATYFWIGVICFLEGLHFFVSFAIGPRARERRK